VLDPNLSKIVKTWVGSMTEYNMEMKVQFAILGFTSGKIYGNGTLLDKSFTLLGNVIGEEVKFDMKVAGSETITFTGTSRLSGMEVSGNYTSNNR
jgi:hypothetical protein